MRITRDIAYNCGPVQWALKKSIDTGFALSYVEARDVEYRAETAYFETLGSARAEFMSKGPASFNQRVAELDSNRGMQGGMADENK